LARGRRRAPASRRRSTKSSRSGVRRTKPAVDPDALLSAVLGDVVSRLGLDILGLSESDYREILRPVVEGVLSRYSSRPSKDALVSRLLNMSQQVYMLAAAYILEKFDRLSEEQLEFIVTNAAPVAAKYVSRLYSELTRYGRKDLIPLLRAAWERYGRPTAVECPYCGFRAVTPDLVCMVCGREVKERDIKEAIGFPERLREMVEFYGPAAAREALERGYIIVGDVVKPPSMPPGEGEVVLHLSPEEKRLLRSLLLSVSRVGGGAYGT
jgi:hypothetical protein